MSCHCLAVLVGFGGAVLVEASRRRCEISHLIRALCMHLSVSEQQQEQKQATGQKSAPRHERPPRC